VLSVAFSPDGKTIASGGYDTTVRLWTIDAKVGPRTLNGHSERIVSVAFSPRGNVLASASAEGSVRLWSARGAALRTINTLPCAPQAVAFSPNSETLAASCSDSAVHFWELASTRERPALQGPTAMEMECIAFAPDGRSLVTTSHGDATVRVWPLGSTAAPPRVVGTRHTSLLNAMAVAPSGQSIAAVGSRGLTVWSADGSDDHVQFMEAAGRLEAVAFAPDGRTLATASSGIKERVGQALAEYGFAVLWPPGQGAVSLGQQDAGMSSVAFAPDGRSLVTGSWDKSVQVWSTVPGGAPRVLRGHYDAVKAVAFAPDGKTFASGSLDRNIDVWSVGQDTPSRVFAGHTSGVNGLAFAPDGRSLVSGSSDWTARVWSLLGNAEPRVLSMHGDAVAAVAFAPDGRTVATGGRDKIVGLWTLEGGDAPRSLEGHGHDVNAVAFMPRGGFLVSSSSDGEIRLWSLSSFATVLTIHTGLTARMAWVLGADGLVELFGDRASTYPLCRVGELTFPLDLCEERAVVPGLIAKVLAGDASERRP
jgi:WD40 repeat protein